MLFQDFTFKQNKTMNDYDKLHLATKIILKEKSLIKMSQLSVDLKENRD